LDSHVRHITVCSCNVFTIQQTIAIVR